MQKEDVHIYRQETLLIKCLSYFIHVRSNSYNQKRVKKIKLQKAVRCQKLKKTKKKKKKRSTKMKRQDKNKPSNAILQQPKTRCKQTHIKVFKTTVIVKQSRGITFINANYSLLIHKDGEQFLVCFSSRYTMRNKTTVLRQHEILQILRNLLILYVCSFMVPLNAIRPYSFSEILKTTS